MTPLSLSIRVGGESVASKRGTSKYFYHNDHLGSVNVVTDIAGTRVQLNEYYPWGANSRASGNIDPDQRFTGQKLDPETGLYYYGGRYYDAEIGRFISGDPFVQDPYDPQNLNRFSYVINNPQNYIDPDGYFHQVKKKKKPGFSKRFFGGILGGLVFILTGNPALGLLTASVVHGGINGGAPGAAMGLFTAGAYIIGGPALGAVFEGITAEMNGGSFGRGFTNALMSGSYSSYFGSGGGPGSDYPGGDSGVMWYSARRQFAGDDGIRRTAGGGDEGRLPPLRFGVPLRFRINLSRPTASHILDKRHGPDWGVSGPTNNQNIAKLEEALRVHMANPRTEMIFGRLGYPPRPALHFYDPGTGRLLSTDFGGNVLRGSGYRLGREQIQHLYDHGWVR